MLSLLYGPALTSTHDYWKNHSFETIQTFAGKVMSLLFNMLSRFVIAFFFFYKEQASFNFMALVFSIFSIFNKFQDVIDADGPRPHFDNH